MSACRAWTGVGRGRLPAAAALAAGAIAALGACGGSGTPSGTTTATDAAASTSRSTGAEVASLLAGIPQRGDRLGSASAPVTVQYFGDLQCPYCRAFTLSVLPTLIERYVRTGQLDIEYRSLQSATHHLGTFVVQQLAALAAGQQNRMWNFIELFYHEQREEDSGYVTESFLQGLAQQVPGLNLPAWTAARSDPRLAAALRLDALAAARHGLARTPSFLLLEMHKVAAAAAIERLLRR